MFGQGLGTRGRIRMATNAHAGISINNLEIVAGVYVTLHVMFNKSFCGGNKRG